MAILDEFLKNGKYGFWEVGLFRISGTCPLPKAHVSHRRRTEES